MEKATEYISDHPVEEIKFEPGNIIAVNTMEELVETISQPKLQIKELLPFEVFQFQEIIHAYYKEVDYKDAVEDVRPFLSLMAQNLKDAYYRFNVAFQDNIPVGYIYFRVLMTPRNKMALEIIQHYTKPEVRGNIRIYKDLVARAMEFGRRCHVQKAIIEVVNLKLRNFYVKAGFKTIHCTLEFDGTYEDFMTRNGLWKKE